MISTNVSTKNSLKSTLYHLPTALHQKTGFFVGWKDIILYLLDLPELKALRHNDISKEELVKMLKDKMTKEELLSLLLG